MTKILVVDDEASILRSTQLLLLDMGFQVVTCADQSQILDTLRHERPDLLLQDVRMPGLDLDKLVASIRADPVLANLPILLFSASMDLDEIQQRVGAVGILEKPFKPVEIVEAIRGAVAPLGGTA
ncbi:MAG TPA: response regulator [Candidatus Thermoplasmatota archaeon]|nr:response regulator [Candidatus Thermoplasmatota archaeon]